jgi:hypothetical protein|tara:strand:- start:118 stop:585 length:468 start_codon:yes stop_codon:yes gene_type:complete
MKFLLTIFGYLFLSNAAIAVDKSGNYAVWGIGMKSCFTFNSVTVNYLNSDETIEEKNNSWISKLKFWENEKDENTELENFDKYRNYIKGYITSYNTFTEDTYSITGLMKEKEVIEWLNNYCEENPMSSLDTALTNFTFEHYEERMKTSRPVRRGF